MKNVLITGLGGFTGAYLKDAFEKAGYHVMGLVQLENDRITADDIVCNITDPVAVKRALSNVRLDGLVHLAALSFVGHKNPIDFYDVNTIGTQNLLDAIAETQPDIRKVILASSANVYGLVGGEKPISEDFPVAPVNHYAISKVAMEYIAQTFFDKLPIIIVRPFNYTGPGQSVDFLIPKVVDHYKRNEKIIELGNLDVSRDFSDVRDVARVYLGLYESDIESEVFNICSGKVYSLAEIISIMNRIVGYEISVHVNPSFVRKNEIKILRGDNSKIKNLTGFRNEFCFHETLKNMFEACS